MESASNAQPLPLISSNFAKAFSLSASLTPANCVSEATFHVFSPKLRWAEMALERAWKGMLSLAKRTPFSLMKMPPRKGRMPVLLE